MKEHGVIGSTEWVEQMRDELNAKGVVYMNFDGAVSGRVLVHLQHLLQETAG